VEAIAGQRLASTRPANAPAAAAVDSGAGVGFGNRDVNNWRASSIIGAALGEPSSIVSTE